MCSLASISKRELHRLPTLHIIKAQRACLLLQEYQRVTPRNGRYTVEQRAAREQLEARFFAISTRAGTSGRVTH
jgi:hypothetical protein